MASSSSPHLRVAALSVPTSPVDLASAVRDNAEAVRRARVDLAVFAELSLTGYAMDAGDVSPDEPQLVPLVLVYAETGCTALVGAPVREGDARWIAVLVVRDGGVEVGYRKMSLGDEEVEHFTSAAVPGAVEVGGWRVGLGVCKDTRIEDHLTATAALGVDVYAAGLFHDGGDDVELDRRARHIAVLMGVPVVFSAAAAGQAIWSRTGVRLAHADAGTDVVVELDAR